MRTEGLGFPNKGAGAAEYVGISQGDPRKGWPGGPVVTFPLYKPARRTKENDGERMRMSKNKIRAALLWGAMLAAMVMSSGVANAGSRWG